MNKTTRFSCYRVVVSVSFSDIDAYCYFDDVHEAISLVMGRDARLEGLVGDEWHVIDWREYQ